MSLAIMTACESGDHQATWSELFQLRDSTVLSDTTLVRLRDALRDAGDRPWRAAGLNTPTRFLWSTFHGFQLAQSVMGIPRAVIEPPYWSSFFHLYGATSGGRIYASTNLLYPIRVYDAAGVLRDSLTDPPPSWRQARRPRRGEFPPGQEEPFRRYLQSFTVITGLAAVSESVLIVTHGGYREEPDTTGGHPPVDSLARRMLGLSVVTNRLDVYVDGIRVLTDAPAPGGLLGYAPGVVFFLRPGVAGRWVVVEYGWRASGSV